MKRTIPLLVLSAALHAAAQSSYPLEGGTRTFVGGDVVHTFTNSGTLVVSSETTVRALFVAGGGGDNGQTPASLGTDGVGSGFATSGDIRPGGRGGCGVVVVAYDPPPAGLVLLVK